MFIADVLFEIHGLVEDTGDFHGVVAGAVEKHMVSTLKFPAAN